MFSFVQSIHAQVNGAQVVVRLGIVRGQCQSLAIEAHGLIVRAHAMVQDAQIVPGPRQAGGELGRLLVCFDRAKPVEAEVVVPAERVPGTYDA